MTDPYLIHFSRLGAPDIGYISVAEAGAGVPFAIQRVFWTYCTPEIIVRGRHAHHATEQVLIAVAGRLTVTTEKANGALQTFRLEDPNIGLYVPPHVWHTVHYSTTAVQLVLASTSYQEDDYIRNFEEFQAIWQCR